MTIEKCRVETGDGGQADLEYWEGGIIRKRTRSGTEAREIHARYCFPFPIRVDGQKERCIKSDQAFRVPEPTLLS